jgi:hypothetical protein
MPATTIVTTATVLDAIADERHYGFGLATIAQLDQPRRQALLIAVAARLGELGASYEDVFHFTNHRNGRWAVDVASGAALEEMAGIAAEYVTRDTFVA